MRPTSIDFNMMVALGVCGSHIECGPRPWLMAFEYLVMTHGYGSWYGDPRIESCNLFSSFNLMWTYHCNSSTRRRDGLIYNFVTCIVLEISLQLVGMQDPWRVYFHPPCHRAIYVILVCRNWVVSQRAWGRSVNRQAYISSI